MNNLTKTLALVGLSSAIAYISWGSEGETVTDYGQRSKTPNRNDS